MRKNSLSPATKFYRLLYSNFNLFNIYNNQNPIFHFNYSFKTAHEIVKIYYLSKTYFNYALISDYTAVDYISYKPKYIYRNQFVASRFLIYTILLSVINQQYIILSYFCNGIEFKKHLADLTSEPILNKLPSLSKLYPSAN